MTEKPWWDDHVLRSDNGKIIKNIFNAVMILDEDDGFNGLLAYQFIGPGHRLPKGALTNRYLHNRESDGGYVVTRRNVLADAMTEAEIDAWKPGQPITSRELTAIQQELQRLGLHKCGRRLTRQAVLYVATRNRLPPPPP
jgi:hypothetical protein